MLIMAFGLATAACMAPPAPSPDDRTAGASPTGGASTASGQPSHALQTSRPTQTGGEATASPAGTPNPPSAPPGEDVFIALVELASEDPSPGGTFVVLASDAEVSLDLGCWRLRTSRGELVIESGSRIPAGGGLRLLFDRGDVANPDRIELRDAGGRVVDATPQLHDTAGDDQLFGRTGDGWTLGRPPLPQPTEDGGFSPDGC